MVSDWMSNVFKPLKLKARKRIIALSMKEFVKELKEIYANRSSSLWEHEEWRNVFHNRR